MSCACILFLSTTHWNSNFAYVAIPKTLHPTEVVMTELFAALQHTIAQRETKHHRSQVIILQRLCLYVTIVINLVQHIRDLPVEPSSHTSYHNYYYKKLHLLRYCLVQLKICSVLNRAERYYYYYIIGYISQNGQRNEGEYACERY